MRLQKELYFLNVNNIFKTNKKGNYNSKKYISQQAITQVEYVFQLQQNMVEHV